MKSALRRHFTAVYYLSEPEVGFDTSMVVWSMFYYTRSPQSVPIARVEDRINEFFCGRQDENPDEKIRILYYGQRAANDPRRKRRKAH